MRRKSNGFSLAEMMIAMLIVSICLAATMPIITKSTSPNAEVALEGVPIGTISLYTGRRIPKGWLYCDGSELPREKFHKLFKVIGIDYGSGNNSTTFNLPNLSTTLLNSFMPTTTPASNGLFPPPPGAASPPPPPGIKPSEPNDKDIRQNAPPGLKYIIKMQ